MLCPLQCSSTKYIAPFNYSQCCFSYPQAFTAPVVVCIGVHAENPRGIRPDLRRGRRVAIKKVQKSIVSSAKWLFGSSYPKWWPGGGGGICKTPSWYRCSIDLGGMQLSSFNLRTFLFISVIDFVANLCDA